MCLHASLYVQLVHGWILLYTFLYLFFEGWGWLDLIENAFKYSVELLLESVFQNQASFTPAFSNSNWSMGSRDSQQSARLIIKILWVGILVGAAGEFSSPELTLCANSYSVSTPPPCYHSGTLKTSVIVPTCRWQVTRKRAYTLDPTLSEWADYTTVQA